MNDAIMDRVDEAVSAMLLGAAVVPSQDLQIRELTAIAADLRYLPRPQFRMQLANELLAGSGAGQQELVPLRVISRSRAATLPLKPPTFRMLGSGMVPRSRLALSFSLHAAALAGLLTSGLWMVQHSDQVKRQVVSLLTESPYVLPPARDDAGGGGGGGDRDKSQASHGSLPRFAREQLTPPAAVVRNEVPKLPAEVTVVGPPELILPSTAQAGDPLATVLAPPSNGVGSDGGIGSGTGGGVGSGMGPGVGPGYGGGIGGGVYHVGGGVSAPRAVYDPDPEYSEEARKAKFQGSVVLSIIVGADGKPRDLRVVRSLGMGLDEKAEQAVRLWRFEPAKKDGHPVAVQVSIEVAFRLY